MLKLVYLADGLSPGEVKDQDPVARRDVLQAVMYKTVNSITCIRPKGGKGSSVITRKLHFQRNATVIYCDVSTPRSIICSVSVKADKIVTVNMEGHAENIIKIGFITGIFCKTNKNKPDYYLLYAPFLFLVCNLLAVSLLPIQQSVVKVFTEALKDPVVISDSRSLIFTGRKVTLQL